MTQINNNTNSRKGKHLSYAERCQIAILKKEGYSNRKSATVLNRAPQTINYEVDRGKVTQVNAKNKMVKSTNIIAKSMVLMLVKLTMRNNA